MGFIVLIALIFLVIDILSNKSLLKPSTLFVLVWLLILIMYQFRFIKLNDISDKTLYIIGIGIVAFSITAMNKKRIIGWSSKKNVLLDLNINVVIMLAIISIIVYIPEVIHSMNMLLSGNSFEVIRAASGSGDTVVTNYAILLLRNYIIRPFTMILYPINAVIFFECRDDKRRIPIFLLTVIICLMMVIYEGGRSPIVYFVLHFIFVTILLKKKIEIPSYMKKWIIIFVVIAFIIFSYVSFSRGIDNLKQSIYMYFCGGIPLLDIKIKEIDINKLQTYGLASLSVPIDFFFSVMGPFGISRPHYFREVLNILMSVEETISVGYNIHMNAFVTMFFYFYLDGGFIGIILGSGIYGLISSICYNNYSYWKDKKSLIIYCMILQGIILSFIRLQFVNSTYFFSFLVLQFLFKRGNYENISDYTIRKN
jgi:oligosaccharide repeat unit polymerase